MVVAGMINSTVRSYYSLASMGTVVVFKSDFFVSA